MSLRPRTYTQAAAAARVGVSRRTIRAWVAAGHLQPVPGSTEALHYPLYAEPDLLRAEQINRAGRTRRRAA